MTVQSYAADIPPHLAKADDLLTRYGRWATSYGARKGAPTLDRQYIREADRSESLEAWKRRREHVPAEPLMPTPDAMLVQRALQRVPDLERIVLTILYVPKRTPIDVLMRQVKVTPDLARRRHLDGLEKFGDNHALLSMFASRPPICA